MAAFSFLFSLYQLATCTRYHVRGTSQKRYAQNKIRIQDQSSVLICLAMRACAACVRARVVLKCCTPRTRTCTYLVVHTTRYLVFDIVHRCTSTCTCCRLPRAGLYTAHSTHMYRNTYIMYKVELLCTRTWYKVRCTSYEYKVRCTRYLVLPVCT